MKIMIEVECTPQEARTFFGLPEVEGMQAELMGTVAERMREALSASDPEALMRTWMPAGLQGWEQMQKMFWAAARGGDDGEKA